MSTVSPRPNFLFLLPDQHRFDWLGTNPHLPLRTPTLDALGARGVRFTHAICPSPLCAPSRACLAAGKEYERCRVPSNSADYPLDQPTYYQRLREAGYRVAGVGKFDLRKATFDWGPQGTNRLWEWGFTEGIDNEGKLDAIASATGSHGPGQPGALPGAATVVAPKGPYMTFLQQRGLAEAHIHDFRTRRNRGTDSTPLPDDAYCDNWIAHNGRRFLERFPKDQPWHLVVNFTGPHSPFDVTGAMRRRWQDVPFPPPVANDDDLSPAQHQAIRQNYAAMIENIDQRCGELLAAVGERGELDRTVVVYSSDHGEMLGDHQRWGKSTYYQPSVGVPLVVAGPGVQRDLVSNALVSLHDLCATFLDYAAAPALPGMDSRSMRPVLEGHTARHRDLVRAGLDGWRMVWDGRYKLVQDSTSAGAAETILFDRQRDPQELENVAERHPDVVARLTPHLHPAG